MLKRLFRFRFLFEELVKRDFKKKYKRTMLGLAWSVLSPLLLLLVMRIIFTHFFGRNMEHYTTYLFCGNLVFQFFSEATSQGMTSLVSNASIYSKVNVPKYLFLLSKNVQTLINFGLSLIVFFIFCVIDHITFTWRLAALIYPIVLLLIFNFGVGLILASLFVFFKDMSYLWSIFLRLLMYLSAIFYTVDTYPPKMQRFFLANPVYAFIKYFRCVVIDMELPSLKYHMLLLGYTSAAMLIGGFIYKKYNKRFMYYL